MKRFKLQTGVSGREHSNGAPTPNGELGRRGYTPDQLATKTAKWEVWPYMVWLARSSAFTAVEERANGIFCFSSL
jgi:hypothetical protein